MPSRYKRNIVANAADRIQDFLHRQGLDEGHVRGSWKRENYKRQRGGEHVMRQRGENDFSISLTGLLSILSMLAADKHVSKLFNGSAKLAKQLMQIIFEWTISSEQNLAFDIGAAGVITVERGVVDLDAWGASQTDALASFRRKTRIWKQVTGALLGYINGLPRVIGLRIGEFTYACVPPRIRRSSSPLGGIRSERAVVLYPC